MHDSCKLSYTFQGQKDKNFELKEWEFAVIDVSNWKLHNN